MVFLNFRQKSESVSLNFLSLCSRFLFVTISCIRKERCMTMSSMPEKHTQHSFQRKDIKETCSLHCMNKPTTLYLQNVSPCFPNLNSALNWHIMTSLNFCRLNSGNYCGIFYASCKYNVYLPL